MARLKGVKVFDAKEGSIEKLKYGGDIYGRTKDLPEKGDIALVIEAWGNQIEGEYYLVINEDHGLYELAKKRNKEKEYVFIEGEAMNASTDLHKVEIFRKVESVQAGDLIEMLEEDDLFGFKINDRFPVFEDSDGDLYIIDKDVDIRYSALDYKYKVVGKSEVEKNGIKYKYVNRKAQRGDMIIPLETSSRYFTNGKLYGPVNEYLRIIDNEGDSLSVYSDGDNRTEDNVLVYEPVIENKTKEKRGQTTSDFRKGMRVKLDVAGNPEYGWGGVSNGDLGVVDLVQSEKLFVDFEKQSDWSALPTELIILDENTEETEYKVGDLVEITEEGTHEFEIGEVVRLNKVDDPTGQPYKAEYLSGNEPDSPWLYGHEFKAFGEKFEDPYTEHNTPKTGDVVEVICGNGHFELGMKLTVLEDSSVPWCESGDGKKLPVLHTRIRKLKKEEVEYVPKLGDIAVVTYERGSSSLEEGDIGIITDHLEGLFRVSVPGKDNSGNLKSADFIRQATGDERKQFAINLVKEGAFA